MSTIRISSLSHPGLRLFSHEGKDNFVAESPNVIQRALEAGYEPVAALCEDHVATTAKDILDRIGESVPVYTGPEEILHGIRGYGLIRGIACVMKRKELPSAEAVRGASRVAVCDGIVDAENIGAILRCSAGLGIDAVLLSPTCCDPLNRRSIRVSMGTVFQMPWTILPRPAVSNSPGSTVSALHAMGFKVAAMALTDKSIPLGDPRPASEDHLAILLGNEGNGLPAGEISAADYVVRIPMAHGVDSLNVAIAGAIAFWEFGKRD